MELETTQRVIKMTADDIQKLAQENGVEDDIYFQTVFERYQCQLSILDKLAQSLKEADVLVEKEYVKGRGNLYTNPAVTEFNRTTDSANKTVATLLKIIRQAQETAAQSEDKDNLLDDITGSDIDE